MREPLDLRARLAGETAPAPASAATPVEDPMQLKLLALSDAAAQAARSMQTLQALLQDILRGEHRRRPKTVK